MTSRLELPDGVTVLGAVSDAGAQILSGHASAFAADLEDSNAPTGTNCLEARLRGSGCVPLYHLMEAAATAEISRTQIWQWRRHASALDDGEPVTTSSNSSLSRRTIRSSKGAPHEHRSHDAAQHRRLEPRALEGR